MILIQTKIQLENNKTGLPKRFGKFSPGFQNFLQVFKSTHFWVYFYFEVKFKVKICVEKRKSLKRYSIATIFFFNKKYFDDDENCFYLYDRFFESN